MPLSFLEKDKPPLKSDGDAMKMITNDTSIKASSESIKTQKDEVTNSYLTSPELAMSNETSFRNSTIGVSA